MDTNPVGFVDMLFFFWWDTVLLFGQRLVGPTGLVGGFVCQGALASERGGLPMLSTLEYFFTFLSSDDIYCLPQICNTWRMCYN